MFNRWLLYKTNYDLLSQYFKGNLSDHELLLSNPDGFAYIVDVDHDIEWRRIFVVALEDIPKEYLPNSSVKYDPNDFEPYTEELRACLDLHFSRLNNVYQMPEPHTALVAEPPSPGYGKK